MHKGLCAGWAFSSKLSDSSRWTGRTGPHLTRYLSNELVLLCCNKFFSQVTLRSAALTTVFLLYFIFPSNSLLVRGLHLTVVSDDERMCLLPKGSGGHGSANPLL